MRWRSPTGLQQLEPEVAVSLARLTGLEGFARAVMVGVIPLAALETFGTKERVSYVFLAGAALSTLVTLHVGTLERGQSIPTTNNIVDLMGNDNIRHISPINKQARISAPRK